MRKCIATILAGWAFYATAAAQENCGAELNYEDADIRAVIDEIFKSTGATQIIHGTMGIGLHLMGGCGMGTDPVRSVVTPDFQLHGFKNIYCADSSIFPNAPGINPSLTIMALSKKAAAQMIKERNR